MAGFTSGFIVVISTHAHEIGPEQYCAKFHTGELRGIAHCAATHKLATCGDGCVKLIDMRDWRVSLGGREVVVVAADVALSWPSSSSS
ncbi:unnamed protein product, partial [Hapterophycus canaliculatus]